MDKAYNYNIELEKYMVNGFKLIILFGDDVILEGDYFKSI